MQAIVLGAGIVGLTTAYTLLKRGYEVTILDQHSEVGHGATFANGAQLSYSYVAPLAGPGVISKIPKWLLDPNSPLRFKPSLKLTDISWHLRFLKACHASRSEQTTAELLKLAYLSRDLYHQAFVDNTFSDIDFNRHGKLVIHRSQSAMQSAIRQLEVQQRLGSMPQQALSAEQCIEKEPALAPIIQQLAGGIYTASEEVADAYKVSLAFKQYLMQHGVKFLFNTTVSTLERQADNSACVHMTHSHPLSGATTHEKLYADCIVVCLGAESKNLLAKLSIHTPIAPLKGYSLTLDITNDTMAPHISITDFERKIVYARLGKRLRLAGMADLVGFNYSIDPSRINALIKEAQAIFAQAGDYTKATQWTGLRPATPLGKPIIDRTPLSNLYLNIGHGALGFTLATGSAHLLADIIEKHHHPLHMAFNLSAAKQ